MAKRSSTRSAAKPRSRGKRVPAARQGLRPMLLAMAADLRIVLIRLSSRLQSLRWYASSKLPCPVSYARETMELFAPLANRLGIWQVKWEMEDLAFRFLEPQTYKTIARQLEEKRGEREAFIARSEGEKQAAINKAQGEASAITTVAEATGQALERVATAIRQPGGEQAVQLKVAESAVEAYSKVAADSNTTLVIPANMTEVSGLITSAMKMMQVGKSV